MSKTWLIWCPPCDAAMPHVVDGPEVACTGCGLLRDSIPQASNLAADPLAEPGAVADLRYCDYCREWKAVGHPVCTGDVQVACLERNEAGGICGLCDGCKRAQSADLERFGSPDDLYIP